MNESGLKKTLIQTMLLGFYAGKTTCLNRYLTGKFNPHSLNNIGLEYTEKDIDSNTKIRIWQTPGNSRYLNIIQAFMKQSHINLIFFNIADSKSLESADKFRLISKNKHSNILIANYIDLQFQGQRKITFEEGFEYARKYTMIYIESSSKDDVSPIFNMAIDLKRSQLGIYRQNQQNRFEMEKKKIRQLKQQLNKVNSFSNMLNQTQRHFKVVFNHFFIKLRPLFNWLTHYSVNFFDYFELFKFKSECKKRGECLQTINFLVTSLSCAQSMKNQQSSIQNRINPVFSQKQKRIQKLEELKNNEIKKNEKTKNEAFLALEKILKIKQTNKVNDLEGHKDLLKSALFDLQLIREEIHNFDNPKPLEIQKCPSHLRIFEDDDALQSNYFDNPEKKQQLHKKLQQVVKATDKLLSNCQQMFASIDEFEDWTSRLLVEYESGVQNHTQLQDTNHILLSLIDTFLLNYSNSPTKQKVEQIKVEKIVEQVRNKNIYKLEDAEQNKKLSKISEITEMKNKMMTQCIQLFDEIRKILKQFAKTQEELEKQIQICIYNLFVLENSWKLQVKSK